MKILDCRGRETLSPGEKEAIAATVRAGGILLFPTDTVYGLGADPFSGAGVEKIYRVKGRPREKPLLVLLEGPHLVSRFAAAVPGPWERLMQRFWPGPLTLLFPARGDLLPGIRSPEGRVALRVPGNALSREVIGAAGGSLTGTSANPAGEEGAADSREAVRALGSALDLIVDAGTSTSPGASTLLGLDAAGRLQVLREGAIGARAVHEALGGREAQLTSPPPVVI